MENAVATARPPATIACMRRILDFLTRAELDSRNDVPGWLDIETNT